MIRKIYADISRISICSRGYGQICIPIIFCGDRADITFSWNFTVKRQRIICPIFFCLYNMILSV